MKMMKTMKFRTLAAVSMAAAGAACLATPAHASLDPQFECVRDGEVVGIAILSASDPAAASFQFSGLLEGIPSVALTSRGELANGRRTYVAVDSESFRIEMGQDRGKLFLGDVFANCQRVAENEEDQNILQAALPLIEMDSDGLNLLIPGLPDNRIDLGHSKSEVIAFVTRYLGDPVETFQSEECSVAPDVVRFAPISLLFKDERWVAWRLQRDDRDIAQRVEVQTLEGLGVGSAKSLALTNGERVPDSSLGDEYFSQGITYVVDEDAQVAAVWSGETCVYR